MDNRTRRSLISSASASRRASAERRKRAADLPADVQGVEVGDTVTLRHTAARGVPDWLAGARATVVALTPKGYKVQAEPDAGKTRLILANQVAHRWPKAAPDESQERLQRAIAALDGTPTLSVEGERALVADLAKPAGLAVAKAASILRVGTEEVQRRLEAMERARVVRHRKSADLWVVRRTGGEAEALRMLRGLAPVPPPRPFLGDEEHPALPPMPEGTVVVDRSKGGALLLVVPGLGRLEGTIGETYMLSERMAEEDHEEFADYLYHLECERVAYVHKVEVSSAARGRGVGRALMIAALRRGAAEGACEAYLIAQPLDDETDEGDLDDFYRDVGMRFADEYDGLNVYRFVY